LPSAALATSAASERRLRALARTSGPIAATVAIEAAPSRFEADIVPGGED